MNDFAMFTEFGNDAVDRIVRSARILKMNWDQVEMELYDLSQKEGFGEATDTAVREAVYLELGFDEVDVDNMDGDAGSALASAGFGTDEDYGYYGDE